MLRIRIPNDVSELADVIALALGPPNVPRSIIVRMSRRRRWCPKESALVGSQNIIATSTMRELQAKSCTATAVSERVRLAVPAVPTT